jgi:hypothetical protein
MLLVRRRWIEVRRPRLRESFPQSNLAGLQPNAEPVSLQGAAGGLVLDRAHQKSSHVSAGFQPGISDRRVLPQFSPAPARPAEAQGVATSGEPNGLASF